ncbi:MAG: FtsQ-type POTRA domain-containing protein [Micrococcaceae bacterium]
MSENKPHRRKPGLAKTLQRQNSAQQQATQQRAAQETQASPMPVTGQEQVTHRVLNNKGAQSLPKLDPVKVQAKLNQEQKLKPAVPSSQKGVAKIKHASQKAFNKAKGSTKKPADQGKNNHVEVRSLSRAPQNSTIALIKEKTVDKVPKKLKIAIGILLPMFLVYAVVWLLVNSSAMSVRNIDVRGNSVVSTEQIEQHLNDLKGEPLAKVNRTDVLKHVVDLSQIQDVAVQAKPPSTLVVNVTERPEAAMIQDGDHYIVIDANGVELRQVQNRDDAKVPVLDGGKAALNQDSFALLSAVMHGMPQDMVPQVDKIAASSPTSALLTLKNGAQVHWGDSSQSQFKGKVLKVLMDKNLASGVQDYDVSTPERPTTTGGEPQITSYDAQPMDLPYNDGSTGGSQSGYNDQGTSPG